jgi:hypothetical protein
VENKTVQITREDSSIKSVTCPGFDRVIPAVFCNTEVREKAVIFHLSLLIGVIYQSKGI